MNQAGRPQGLPACLVPLAQPSQSLENRARENEPCRLRVGSLCLQLSTLLPRAFAYGGVPSAGTLVRKLLSFQLCLLPGFELELSGGQRGGASVGVWKAEEMQSHGNRAFSLFRQQGGDEIFHMEDRRPRVGL